MAYTSSIKLGGRFCGLFVGGQGTGKTVGAASFPGPIKFYDFDGRMTPVKRFYPNRQDIQYSIVSAYKPPPGRPDIIDFHAFATEWEAYQNGCSFATMVIDSITSLTACVVRYVMNRKRGVGVKKIADIEIPSWDEFNAEAQSVIEIIEISKILPCHIIFTAHPVDKLEIVTKAGEEGGKIETIHRRQSITAFGMKTPNFVPNYFDEIYNFAKVDAGVGRDPARVVITQAGEDVLCKTALPLPARFDITNRPLFGVIQDYLKQHEIALAESVQKLKDAAASSTTPPDASNTPST